MVGGLSCRIRACRWIRCIDMGGGIILVRWVKASIFMCMTLGRWLDFGILLIPFLWNWKDIIYIQ